MSPDDAPTVGTSLGTSAWRTFSQETVDRHAETTGDAQWIHNDPERATRESPFGGPIVQGFLLLASLTSLSAELEFPRVAGATLMVNYGFDRVRFVRPVMVGEPVRLNAFLGSVTARTDGGLLLGLDCELATEASGVCVVARWIFLAVA